MSGQGVTRLRTIGEALRSAREAQGKSLDDAAVATRIRPSYLDALEEERFGALGGSVYAKGFLRSYAGYLGLDPAPLLEAYRAQETPAQPVFEHAPRRSAGSGPAGSAATGWPWPSSASPSSCCCPCGGCCARRPTRASPS